MAGTEFSCRGCGCTMRSAKELQPGANVRCPKCSLVFKYGEDAKTAPADSPKSAVAKSSPSSPKSSPPAPKSEPPARKTGTSSSRMEDRPAVSRRRSDDDDYDDRDDRPRRKRPKKAQSGSNTVVLLAVGGVALLLVVVGAAVGGYFLLKKDPSKTVASSSQPVTRPMPQFGGTPLPEPSTKPASSPTPPSTTKTDTPPMETSAGPVSTGGPASVKDIYDYVLKSTVLVVNEIQGGVANGTGSVVDANERLILTNFHVVANHVKLEVFFPTFEGGKLVSDKDRYLGKALSGGHAPANAIQGEVAEVLATDTQRDLALIRVSKLRSGTEALPLAKGMVNIGQTVHSIGNPGASGALWIYTQGAVRAVYRHKWKTGGGDLLLTLDAEIIETQSPTNQGDSGGPLVNDRGELVGVTEGKSTRGSLISTFISLNEARDFIEREYQRKFAKAWSPVARTPLRARGGSGGADVTSLISALDSKEAKNRASAAQNLGDMGADAKLAIRRLVKALKDPDDLTRRCSAEALTKIGAPSRDDLTVLTEALTDSAPEVRRYASTAIGQIGPEAAAAADQLVQAMIDDDVRVRESLVRSLGSLGPDAKKAAVPGLTKALKDSAKEVRIAAASAVTNLMSPPTAADVPLLVTILKHQDPEARVFGARHLAKLGKDAKAAIPDLIEAAKGQDPGARRGAIDTLAAIGPDAKTVVPIYVAALKDGDVGVRQSALLAIGQLGKELDKEKDKETIAAVVDAVKDSDKQVKKAALAAVGKLGAVIGVPGAKVVMPSVIDDLQDKDASVRDQAHETIAGLGPLAKDAVNPLIGIMEKKDVKLYIKDRNSKPFLQEADEAFLDKIAKTLGKIGLPAVKPLLRSLDTTNINAGLIIGCCRALGEVGPPAKEAISRLQLLSNALPQELGVEADRAMRKIRR